MKTTNIAALTLALSIALAGSLMAAPRSKHVGQNPHHYGEQGANVSAKKHTVLKWIGPRSKGYRNPHFTKD